MEWWSAYSGYVLDERNTRFKVVAVCMSALQKHIWYQITKGQGVGKKPFACNPWNEYNNHCERNKCTDDISMMNTNFKCIRLVKTTVILR